MKTSTSIHERIDSVAARYDGRDYRRELLALAEEVGADRKAYAEVMEQVRLHDESIA